jgi:hypothetical protein
MGKAITLVVCVGILGLVILLGATGSNSTPPEQMYGRYTASERNDLINHMRATRSDPEAAADMVIQVCSDESTKIYDTPGMCPPA